MKFRHPIQGLDTASTSNRDHARQADATASLFIAILTIAALGVITLIATRR